MAKILVIDDCETTLELLVTRLEMDGHEVMPTASGRQALALFACDAFDLIITDVYMPDVDGLEILKELRTMDARIPIIAISANGLSIDMFPVAKSLGAFATVAKPIDFALLSAAIGDALERHRAAVQSDGATSQD